MAKYLACDIETDSLSPLVVHCIAFYGEGISEVFPWGGAAKERLAHYLEGGYTLVFHNASFDVYVLRTLGGVSIPPGSYVCTQVLAHAVNPQRHEYSLDSLSGGKKIDYVGAVQLSQPHLTPAEVYALPFSPLMEEYCLTDTQLTWELWGALSPHLQRDQRLHDSYFGILVPFIEVIISMRGGIEIDIPGITSLMSDLHTELSAAYSDLFVKYPTTPGLSWDKSLRQWVPTGKHKAPNLASPNDVSSLLITRGWIPTEFNRDTGRPVASQAVLNQLVLSEDTPAELREVVKHISNIRQLTGILNQTVSIASLLHQRGTTRLCADWNQTGAVTHRITSSKPNLQNLAVRHPRYGQRVRANFIPPTGYSMLVGDLSQIELCILAYYLELLLGDSRMAESTRQGRDIHTGNTENWYSLDEATTDPLEFALQRKKCKNGIFASNYGAYAKRVSLTLGISVSEAQEILRTVDENTDIAALKDLVWNQCAQHRDVQPVEGKTHGFVYDLMGVRHFYPLINSNSRTTRQRTQRQVFNCLMQGGSFSIFASLLNKLLPTIQQYGGWVASTVHDEAILMVPTPHAPTVLDRANEVFSSLTLETPQGGVRVTAEFNIVNNWSEK
jgi:DNA polymerase I